MTEVQFQLKYTNNNLSSLMMRSNSDFIILPRAKAAGGCSWPFMSTWCHLRHGGGVEPIFLY